MKSHGAKRRFGEKRISIVEGWIDGRKAKSFHVKPRTIHRFCATTTDVKLAEVSTPEIDDVVRLEDKYSR